MPENSNISPMKSTRLILNYDGQHGLFVNSGSMTYGDGIDVGDSMGHLIDESANVSKLAASGQGLSIDLLKELRGYPSIKSVTFYSCGIAFCCSGISDYQAGKDAVFAAFKEFLATNTTLETISFVRMSLQPSAIEAISEGLAANTSIKFLHFKHVTLEERGVQALAAMLRSRGEANRIEIVLHDAYAPGDAPNPLLATYRGMLDAAMLTPQQDKTSTALTMFENARKMVAAGCLMRSSVVPPAAEATGLEDQLSTPLSSKPKKDLVLG